MDVDESNDQGMPTDVDMRVVTQDTPIHGNPRLSSNTEQNQSQKKQKIRSNNNNNNYGQDTTEHMDQSIGTNDTTPEGTQNFGNLDSTNLAEDKDKGQDQSHKTQKNPYKASNLFQQAMNEAEERKKRNNKENQGATSLLIRFSIRGWHEDKPFSNDINLYKSVIMAIWEKTQKTEQESAIHPWNEDCTPIRNQRDIEDLINEENRNNYLYIIKEIYDMWITQWKQRNTILKRPEEDWKISEQIAEEFQLISGKNTSNMSALDKERLSIPKGEFDRMPMEDKQKWISRAKGIHNKYQRLRQKGIRRFMQHVERTTPDDPPNQNKTTERQTQTSHKRI